MVFTKEGRLQMKSETSYFSVSSYSALALCIALQVLEQDLAAQEAMSWFLLLR